MLAKDQLPCDVLVLTLTTALEPAAFFCLGWLGAAAEAGLGMDRSRVNTIQLAVPS